MWLGMMRDVGVKDRKGEEYLELWGKMGEGCLNVRKGLVESV